MSEVACFWDALGVGVVGFVIGLGVGPLPGSGRGKVRARGISGESGVAGTDPGTRSGVDADDSGVDGVWEERRGRGAMRRGDMTSSSV